MAVTVWRELRRLGGAEFAGLLGDLLAATDRGDWSRYVELMGGARAKRKEQPVTLAKAWSDEPGRYHEPLGWQLHGLECGSLVIPTRIHEWTIRSKPIAQRRADTPALDETAHVGAQPNENEYNGILEASPPWSSVNNCTARIGSLDEEPKRSP